MLSANQMAAFLYVNHISGTIRWNSLIFCMLIQIHGKLKIYWKSWANMVKSGCCHSCHRTLRLAVTEEWIDGINWFFACWCKFRKGKSYFNRLWHMKNKSVWQSHSLSQKSEAIDVWKIARHPPSRRMVACHDYSF